MDYKNSDRLNFKSKLYKALFLDLEMKLSFTTIQFVHTVTIIYMFMNLIEPFDSPFIFKSGKIPDTFQARVKEIPRNVWALCRKSACITKSWLALMIQ